MESIEEKSNIVIAILKNSQVDKAPTIILHFGCNNNIFVDCIFELKNNAIQTCKEIRNPLPNKVTIYTKEVRH